MSLLAVRAVSKSFWVVEHTMEFVMELCHMMYVMHRGVTIAAGPLDEVRQNTAVRDAYLGL